MTAQCIFDGPVAPAAFVVISQKTAGQCHAIPFGPVPGDLVIIGRVSDGQYFRFSQDPQGNVTSIEATIEFGD